MKPVRLERTFWRDEGLSQRHRLWGYDLPAVDIDFLLIEYDRGIACALVDYKIEFSAWPDLNSASFRAMIDIASNRFVPIPAFIVRYAADFSWYDVIGLNLESWAWMRSKVQRMTERQWVEILYRLRGYEPPNDLWQKLKPSSN